MDTRRNSALKTLRCRRAELCYDRRVWELKVPNVLPFDITIGCHVHDHPYPPCEGCTATLYRADRLAEIAAGIKAIDAEITAITGTPYGTAKAKQPKPRRSAEQLPLFA